jgi:SAM-dependent methyltransferase
LFALKGQAKSLAFFVKERMMFSTVLHVGAGHPDNRAPMPAGFQASEWKELCLDIDPANKPDIVGSMLDMSALADASVDAIYSSHNIEHVYAHEVRVVLKEFRRVLKPTGFLVVICPDLQTVAQLIAEDKLTEAPYNSPAGPITPLDILYGYRPALAQGNHFMAHKCGFTLKVLLATLQGNGFAAAAGKRRPHAFDLWAVAGKSAMTDADVRAPAGQYLLS